MARCIGGNLTSSAGGRGSISPGREGAPDAESVAILPGVVVWRRVAKPLLMSWDTCELLNTL